VSIFNSDNHAVLYIVATPIGNLDDITHRAVEVLKTVDLVAAEDTRHSQKLLNHLGINTRMLAYHEHNEQDAAAKLITEIEQGSSVALISDAGTPLISDPGYRVVELAHQRGVRVVPIPGASAALAALSIAGLPTDSFLFEGFLPAKHQARVKALECLLAETRTTVIYESCHRIKPCLRDMQDVLGAERRLTFTRELTKAYETVRQMTIGECLQWVEQDEQQSKGEIVMVLAGAPPQQHGDAELATMMQVLIAELPLKQAATLAAKLSGRNKNECYQLGLELKDQQDG